MRQGKRSTTLTRRSVSASPSASPTPSEALKADITRAAEALCAEMQAGVSDRYRALMTFASRFWRYSIGNQFLILMQRPNATRVAGYRTWEQLGYHVARGERGIRILAPRPYTRTEVDAEGEERREQRGIYFVSVAVFDASQLNPEEVAAKPLPEFFPALGSDAETEALVAQMRATLAREGVTVVDRDDLPAGAQGVSLRGHRIALRTGLPSRNQVRTLAHEWGHELLHQGPDGAALERGIKECHAEAVAYIVCAHYGLHNDWSSDYLQDWGNTPAILMAQLGQVQGAAAHIIRALESTTESESE